MLYSNDLSRGGDQMSRVKMQEDFMVTNNKKRFVTGHF